MQVGPGWEDHRAWTLRLLRLARAHRRLAVSLPFTADDDVDGSGTVALVTSLLDLDGSTPDDCGDISLDAEAPAGTGPALSGELAHTSSALDELESLLTSPLWEPDDALGEAGTVAV